MKLNKWVIRSGLIVATAALTATGIMSGLVALTPVATLFASFVSGLAVYGSYVIYKSISEKEAKTAFIDTKSSLVPTLLTGGNALRNKPLTKPIVTLEKPNKKTSDTSKKHSVLAASISEEPKSTQTRPRRKTPTSTMQTAPLLPQKPLSKTNKKDKKEMLRAKGDSRNTRNTPRQTEPSIVKPSAPTILYAAPDLRRKEEERDWKVYKDMSTAASEAGVVRPVWNTTYW